MPAPRPFALVASTDQWLRAAHTGTALLGGAVQLHWREAAALVEAGGAPFIGGADGLAFDPRCRLYHSVAAEGRVERALWAAEDPLRPAELEPAPLDLFAAVGSEGLGDFVLAEAPAPTLDRPRGLAVDGDERLFVAESGARRILVYDLWSRRLLRHLPLRAEPLDLVADGRTLYVLLGAGPEGPGLMRFTARSEPESLRWPAAITAASRLARAPDGGLFVLDHAGQAEARVVRVDRPDDVVDVPFATDLEILPPDPTQGVGAHGGDPILVVARRPGEDFALFGLRVHPPDQLPPLKARGYDGRGIVRTPDGRIGFWTAGGFRHAVAARLRYESGGTVISFRLDSGVFQTVWGRVFLDACIPRETRVLLRCVTADEPPGDAPMSRPPPANTPAPAPFPHLSPPMPPQTLADDLNRAPQQALHRRETGCEQPWVRPQAGDPFETYEAPVLAGPGRYLWIRLELSGNTRVTPRLRALRAEYPAHDYLDRLPGVLARDPDRGRRRDREVADFFRRYLAIAEGLLGDLEARADARAVLLDPRSAPPEVLPWLAGFVGLALDERMAHAPRPAGRTEDVRRQLIREAVWLFRFRGTVPGLRRFLEIYLDVAPLIIEKFRLRGVGGPVLGSDPNQTSRAVLGAGFRIGGALGEEESVRLTGSGEDAFATHAHRFTVILPAVLEPEHLDVVQHILEVHRPAHTAVDVCTVGAGMRVGRGLHLGLSSVIGPTGGFRPLRVAGSYLGRGVVIGRPEAGTFPGASRLGEDTRVG